MHKKQIVYAGKPVHEAEKALILLHGRGATAEDILSLSEHLNVRDFALLAPRATNQTWYPYSFMAKRIENEPWLSSAVDLIGSITEDLVTAGIIEENIFFAGFSQGACLTLEFITSHARKWGGAAAFTGGLPGESLDTERYTGSFYGTPVYIGTSDPDPHVPVSRVKESAEIIRTLNGNVTINIYPGMGHTINQDEIVQANKLVFVQN